MKQETEIKVFIVLVPIWLSLALLCPSHARGAAGAAGGDADRGKVFFEKRCTGCHSLDNNKEGPRLHYVYGRKAGSVSDFGYSDQLKAAHILWDEHSLDRWLTNPDAVVPDNDMAFRVSDPHERADIIQFLRVSSGK